MLSNRYYLGYVSFRGVEYQGRHQPLVSVQTFDRVQAVLSSRFQAGEKQRVHNHYLKGTVVCARCGSRLCLTNAKGRYLYFFCVGRHQGSDCDLPYMLAEQIEDEVESVYAREVRLTDDQQAMVRNGLCTEVERQRKLAVPEAKRQELRTTELEQERRRLAREVVKGNIPGDLARVEQDRIAAELADAQRVLAVSRTVFAHIEDTLSLALEYVGRCHDAYRLASPQVRRQMNQFFWLF